MMTAMMITMTPSPIVATTYWFHNMWSCVTSTPSAACFTDEETEAPWVLITSQDHRSQGSANLAEGPFLPLNHNLPWDTTTDRDHLVTAWQPFPHMGLTAHVFFRGLLFRSGEGACFVTQGQVWKKKVFTWRCPGQRRPSCLLVSPGLSCWAGAPSSDHSCSWGARGQAESVKEWGLGHKVLRWEVSSPSG